MRRRMKNEKGFTLAELLIVVAIIAVLVAVSIPIFTAQLEKAREATDVANFRAAKAAYIVAVLDGTITPDDVGTQFYYHADSGTIKADEAPAYPYGEGTTSNPFKALADGSVYPSPYAAGADYSEAVIYAKYTSSLKKDSLEIHWEGSKDPDNAGGEAPFTTIDLGDNTVINVNSGTDTSTNAPISGTGGSGSGG